MYGHIKSIGFVENPLCRYNYTPGIYANGYIYLTTKETWHLVFVNILVLNEITVHLYSLCLNLNYRSLRCIENF